MLVAATLLGLSITTAASAEPKKSAPVPLVAEYDEGFSLRTQDGAYRLRIGGYAQILGRAFVDDPTKKLTDQVVARSLRPTIEGTVFRYFDLRLQPDFGNGKAIIQDAYVDVHAVPWLRVRIGKMKAPFGLERLMPETGLSFVERALPTQLAPNRDLGLQVHGSIENGTIEYAFGGFDGVPDGGSVDGDSGDGKDVVGRIFARPLRPTGVALLRDIGVGFAASYGSRSGTLDSPDVPTLKTAGQATFFSYKTGTTLDKTTVADGANDRFGPQAAAYVGPVGVWFEYFRTRQALELGTKKARSRMYSWQLAGSFVIGGDASSDGAKPKRSVGEGGFGAGEIVGRYSELGTGDGVFQAGFADATKSASKARSFVVGANYVLNRNFKVQLDFERTTFVGGAKSGNRATENAFLLLAQGVL